MVQFLFHPRQAFQWLLIRSWIWTSYCYYMYIFYYKWNTREQLLRHAGNTPTLCRDIPGSIFGTDVIWLGVNYLTMLVSFSSYEIKCKMQVKNNDNISYLLVSQLFRYYVYKSNLMIIIWTHNMGYTFVSEWQRQRSTGIGLLFWILSY